jgi:predicted methyltransferase
VRAIAADEHYKNVTVSVEKVAELKLPEKLDMVWTSQNYHDVHNVKDIDVGAFNKVVFESLKPGGIYIVIDHAREGCGLQRHVDLASQRSRGREDGSDGGRLRVRRLERRHLQLCR